MAGVTFDQVSKIYPDGTRAVSDMELDIDDGEFMVLVGPSGCGKTTALRMVAGLEEISEGVLKIGDRVVNHVPPRDRDIAMVFQSYALYPHLSVYDNIAFGLKLKKEKKAEIQKRVQEAALAAGLEPELRPWHPHITIARCRNVSAQSLRKFLQANAEFDAGMVRVEAFHLYSSKLTPAGPIHTGELTVSCSRGR